MLNFECFLIYINKMHNIWGEGVAINLETNLNIQVNFLIK